MWGWWCRSGIPWPGRRPWRSDSWFPPYWAPSSRPWRSWAQLWAGNYYPLIMLLLTTLCSPVTTPRIDLGVARQPPVYTSTPHISHRYCVLNINAKYDEYDWWKVESIRIKCIISTQLSERKKGWEEGRHSSHWGWGKEANPRLNIC